MENTEDQKGKMKWNTIPELLDRDSILGKEIASKMGITPTTLSNWCQQTSQPKPWNAHAFAKAFNDILADRGVSKKRFITIKDVWLAKPEEMKKATQSLV